jgi:hypothetical protein
MALVAVPHCPEIRICIGTEPPIVSVPVSMKWSFKLKTYDCQIDRRTYWKVYVIIYRLKMKKIFKGLFNRKGQKEEKDKTTPSANIKCKECGMQFQSKDNLQVHKKKAHSGK